MLDGAARLEAEAAGVSAELGPGDYAYLPPDAPHRLSSAAGAGLLLFERRYALGAAGGRPQARPPYFLFLLSSSAETADNTGERGGRLGGDMQVLFAVSTLEKMSQNVTRRGAHLSPDT